MQPNPTILKANRDGEKSVFPIPNGLHFFKLRMLG